MTALILLAGVVLLFLNPEGFYNFFAVVFLTFSWLCFRIFCNPVGAYGFLIALLISIYMRA